MSETDKLRLGRTTRVLAWGFGVLGAVSGVIGVGAAVLALADDRVDDLWRFGTVGLSGLVVGFMMLHAARAGRDTTTEFLNRFGPGPNSARRPSS